MKTPNPLPEADRRHRLQFHFLNSVGYRRRLGLSALLFLSGLTLQFFWQVTFILTGPLLLAGTLLLLIRGYDLEPEATTPSGEWEKTTRERFQDALDKEKKIASWDQSFSDITCGTGFGTLIFVVISVSAVVIKLADSWQTQYWASIFAGDAAIILLPHWITGTRRGWRPVSLSQEISAVETALDAIDRFDQPACQIQPLFDMAGKGNKQTPVSARAFIRFPDAPEEFLGIQFQVSLNNVQGTQYPYLYAVLVAREPFGLHRKCLDTIQKYCSEMTVETSTEGGVEAIVIRQPTTRTSGYHTKPAAIRGIALASWNGTKAILGSSASV